MYIFTILDVYDPVQQIANHKIMYNQECFMYKKQCILLTENADHKKSAVDLE